MPPRLSQSCHEPSHHLCQSALSVPFTKISRRLGPQEAAAGPEVRIPPRLSQLCQEKPSHHLCQSALSVPRTKTSMRLNPQETAAGPELRIPPRLSQLCQEKPSHHLC